MSQTDAVDQPGLHHGLLDVSQEPGYDSIAYQWAFPQYYKPGPAHQPVSQVEHKIEQNLPDAAAAVVIDEEDEHIPGVDDVFHLQRLRRTVGNWSLGLCIAFLFILIVGQYGFHRQVGPYVIMNIFCCIEFGVGAFTLRLHERHSSLHFLQLFFAFVFAALVIGIPLGIYQLTKNADRVAAFCAERAGGSCTPTEQNNYLVFAHIVGVCGLLTWFALATLFMRCQFVLICAIERASSQHSSEAIHPAILFCASWIPNYPMMYRVALAHIQACIESPDWSVFCDWEAAGAFLFAAMLYIIFLPISLPLTAYGLGSPLLSVVIAIAELVLWVWMNAECRSTGSWIACSFDIWAQICVIILDAFARSR